MKRLLIIISLGSLAVQGQEPKPKQTFLLGFNFFPSYSYRALKNNDGSSSSDLVIKNRNDIEIAKFGYAAAVNILFDFRQGIGLETGVQYSSKGYKTIEQDFVYFPPDPSLPTKGKTTYSYNYFGIPLKARFSFGNAKLRFTSTAGVISSFLLSVKQTSDYQYSNGTSEKKKQSATSGFEKIDISTIIGVGIKYKVDHKSYFTTEPTFSYGLLKTKDAPVAERLWNIGLNIGFYFDLR
jgi:hypothetical protein